MRMHRSLGTATGLLLGILLLATPCLADWLVLEDGSRVKTRGPWEVKGQMVLFHLPNGAYSSIRLDSVDLETSESVTREAKRPKPPPQEAEPRAPVLVLTDADVGHVDPTTLDEAEDEARTEASTSQPEEPGGLTSRGVPQPDRVRVIEWEETDSESGVAFVGTIRNISRAVVGDITLEGTLLDSDGEILQNQMATLGATAIRPGAEVRFQVAFPGTFSYQDIEFAIRHVALDTEASTDEAEVEEIEVPMGTEEDAPEDEEPDS